MNPNRKIPAINLDLASTITSVTETVSGAVDITLTMVDSITAYNAVTIDGKQANSATVGHRNKIAGLALVNISAGFSGKVRTLGEVFNPSWTWTAGQLVFLNSTSLSTTPPSTGFIEKIGIAKDTFTLLIELGDAILL